MKVKIVRIGNSKGIRIPKDILVRYKIGEAVELKVEEGALALRPSGAGYAQWPTSLKKASKVGLVRPSTGKVPSWKKGGPPLHVPGVSLSRMIIKERRQSRH